MATLLVALDLAGTFVFALSGALVGVRHRLDLFGVLVLAFAAATAGGVLRDLIIGAVPPPAVADPRYFVVPVIAGLVTFFWHPVVTRLQSSVLVLDGAGLALFAVSGAFKALEFGLGPVAGWCGTSWCPRCRPCSEPSSTRWRRWLVRRSWSSVTSWGSLRRQSQ